MFLMIAVEEPGKYLTATIIFSIVAGLLLLLLIIAIMSIVKGFKSGIEWDRCEAEDTVIASILMGLLFIGCIVGIVMFSGKYNKGRIEYAEWYNNYHEEVIYNEIYSVTRENEVGGHFTLGSGTVNTDTYYYFYIQTEPNVYKLTKLKVDGNTYIKEVDNNFNIIAINPENSFTIKYYVNVPKGTIIKSYNV